MKTDVLEHSATANKGHVTFRVLDCGVEVDIATRIPKHHKGWQSVLYKGERYQLLGGIRSSLFIKMGRELKGLTCYFS